MNAETLEGAGRVLTASTAGDMGFACIVDTETTGLSWYWDEIVELGLLLFAYDVGTGRVRAVLDEYSGLREPACPVTRGAYEKHRLAPADLKGHTLDELRIASLVDRAEIMISHNLEFDLPFWQKHFPMLPKRPWVCSMKGIPWREWGHSRRGLQELLRSHGLRVSVAHRAESDAGALLGLLSISGPHGKTYLAEVLAGRRYTHLALDPGPRPLPVGDSAPVA